MENRKPNIKSILVATDFSECAKAALRRAVWLAEQTRAQLTVAHVLSDVRRELCAMPADARQDLFGGDTNRFERELRRKADRKLEALVTPHRRRGFKLNYETLLGVPFVEIIHAVQKEGYDLVLAGTRGLSGLKRFLVGSTAEQLVRKCPCPVWIVKAGHERPVRSILVPVDFSDVSGKTLQLAAWRAAQANARVSVLHVFDVPAETAIQFQEETTEADMRQYRSQVRRTAHDRLREFVRSHEPSITAAQLRLARGEPSRAIASWARQAKADLVVLGSVARTGIPGFLIGNTGEKLLRTVDCSILAVKPDGFVSPVQPAFWSLHPAAEESETLEIEELPAR